MRLTAYYHIGLGVGLLSIYTIREVAGCYEPAFYAISGLIAAIREAIREARGEGYG